MEFQISKSFGLPDVSVKESKERVVCDYIAGMTDRYSVMKFKEIFLPNSWKIV